MEDGARARLVVGFDFAYIGAGELRKLLKSALPYSKMAPPLLRFQVMRESRKLTDAYCKAAKEQAEYLLQLAALAQASSDDDVGLQPRAGAMRSGH